MKKPMLTKLLVTLILMAYSVAFAANALSFIKQGQPYHEVKQMLISRGWAPVENAKIDKASLYAQEVYAIDRKSVV